MGGVSVKERERKREREGGEGRGGEIGLEDAKKRKSRRMEEVA